MRMEKKNYMAIVKMDYTVAELGSNIDRATMNSKDKNYKHCH